MSIKTQAIKGTAWSAIEKFSLLGIQFILQIVLARLLVPSDYGIVAMLAIFIALSNTFIDCGFSSFLIQNQKRTETDFSTAFYFNFGASLICYGILFVAAPYIAKFYNTPILTSVTRVLTLSLPLSALGTINRTKLQINIDFKTQTKATLTSVMSSGIIGIILAYKGFGVWALVTQMLLNSIFNTILLFILIKWFPKEKFSISSFKKMFSFGVKLLFSSVLDTFYLNIYPMILGKFYSAHNLGVFTRAYQFAVMPTSVFIGIFSRVVFPLLSKVNNDLDKMVQIHRKYLRITTAIFVPIVLGLGAVAKPLIIVLLGEKWIESIPLLQILCFACIFDTVININTQALLAKGCTNLVLKINFVKKTFAFIILFASLKFGLIVVCLGKVLYEQVSTIITIYYAKKVLNLGYFRQIKDILPICIVSVISVFTAYIVTFFQIDNLLKLIVAIPLAIIVYILLAYVFKFEIITEGINLFNILKNKHKKV